MDEETTPSETVIVIEHPITEGNAEENREIEWTNQLALLKSEISDLRTELTNHQHPELLNRLVLIETRLDQLTTSPEPEIIPIPIPVPVEESETVETPSETEIVEVPEPPKTETEAPKNRRLTFL